MKKEDQKKVTTMPTAVKRKRTPKPWESRNASKLVESFLFGMKPNDPWTLAAAVATLLAAALVAAYLPARKASRIDPMAALRHD